jgi:hypothetical protein
MKRRKNQRLFVQLHLDLLNAPAWRAMGAAARVLYIALKRQFNGKNNGELYLSHREAVVELGLARPTIARGFLELQHYGFTVMTSPGWLGIDGKGRAPHWRLTEIDTADSAATMDFKRWDKTGFKPPPPKPRKGKRRSGRRRSELQQEIRR